MRGARERRRLKPYSRRTGKRRPTWYKARAGEDPIIVSDIHQRLFERTVRNWEELKNRGEELEERFEIDQDDALLEKAIQCYTKAAQISLKGVGDAVYSFGRLATVLLERFERKGDLVDLLAAIHNYESVLSATSSSDPDHAATLVNLANALRMRFKEVGDLTDLEAAITYGQASLELIPSTAPERYKSHTNLAMALEARFQESGNIPDIDAAISQHRVALKLTPLGHPERCTSFSNLATALQIRCERVEDRAELDTAIAYHQAALELQPLSHPDHSTFLGNFANALLARFKQTGDRASLNAAIEYHQTGLGFRPQDHPDRSSSFNNLADALLTRFEQVGDLTDLDTAIAHLRTTLQLTPAGHPDRSTPLINLACALQTRFEQVGDRTDLDAGISHSEAALELKPTDHPARSVYLNNLATALQTRFEEFEDPVDIDAAITYHQAALELRPPGHPDRSMSLNNLANALRSRFALIGDRVDLDDAIIHHHAALELRPQGHPLRSTSLNNLGNALQTRFGLLGDLTDLDKAIAYHRAALELIPPGHPDRSDSLNNLATALLTRFETPGGRISQDESNEVPLTAVLQGEILAILEEATFNATGGPPRDRFMASFNWVTNAVKWSHSTAIQAHRVSLSLLETIIASGSSLEARHLRFKSFEARGTESLAVDAAACAIAADQVKIGLELLEQGRTMLLTQAGKYRMRVEDLEAIQPALAAEFRTVSTSMEASAGRPDNGEDSALSVEDAVAKFQNLSQRWDAVVEQIRRVNGFESFLRPIPFNILQKAAKDGPVIVLVISEIRSDAIIVRSDADPHLVALVKATPDVLAELVDMTNCQTSSNYFMTILRWIWELIVRPVVFVLQNEFHLPPGSRIWWCPTGAASHLPLHAAGEYDTRGPTLPALYISSYTTNMNSLIKSRESSAAVPDTSPQLLVVGQPTELDEDELPSVQEEIKCLERLFPSVTVLESSVVTREAIFGGMAVHKWLHLTCHGHVDQAQPFNSYFAIVGGPLKLSEILRENLPKADIAFLSACHSAAGNRDRSDEALHLVAGLQFAGYKSVVGTLWELGDNTGPLATEEFWSTIRKFQEEGKDVATMSAKALHRAVNYLRRATPKVEFADWVCFVHYGC